MFTRFRLRLKEVKEAVANHLNQTISGHGRFSMLAFIQSLLEQVSTSQSLFYNRILLTIAALQVVHADHVGFVGLNSLTYLGETPQMTKFVTNDAGNGVEDMQKVKKVMLEINALNEENHSDEKQNRKCATEAVLSSPLQLLAKPPSEVQNLTSFPFDKSGVCLEGFTTLFKPSILHNGVGQVDDKYRGALFDYATFKAYDSKEYHGDNSQVHPICFAALTREPKDVEGIREQWVKYSKDNKKTFGWDNAGKP